MRSPRTPLIGAALMWLWYAGFVLLVPPAQRESVPHDGMSASVRLPGPNTAANMGRSPRAAPPDTPAPSESAPPGDASAVSDEARATKPRVVLTPGDAALLELLSDAFDPKDLSKLEAFVAAYPEHALGRALLVGFLLSQKADPAAIRPHIEALRALMPDKGTPDLFMAGVALREGRADLARQLIIDASRKDLTWLLNSEFVRLRIASALDRGTAPFTIIRDAFSIPQLPLLRLGHDLARATLADEEGDALAADPQTRIETARALVKVGESMQNHGLILIENIVGSALVKTSLDALEKAGALADDDRILLRRVEALRGEMRLLSGHLEQTLTAERMQRYLEDLIRYGELRASLRGYMDCYGAAGDARRAAADSPPAEGSR